VAADELGIDGATMDQRLQELSSLLPGLAARMAAMVRVHRTFPIINEEPLHGAAADLEWVQVLSFTIDFVGF
jgi:hypothetical protein